MRKWIGFAVTGVILVLLLGATGCVKSKLPDAPTVIVTSQAMPTTSADQTPTVAVGETVVSADATATATPAEGETPIPDMTATATSEPEATATSVPEATATPTSDTGTGTGFQYTVQTGDTLWGLAIRFGTTVEAIKSANSLTSDVIYKGNKLTIPGVDDGGTTGGTVTHVVQAGENLFRISLKYGTTVGAIAAANGIINPSYVYTGQELIIPQGSGGTTGSAPKYHVVQPGETLWSIALRYGTTPWTIASLNGISNPNFIYSGRTLRIP
jgi:LysM repeat protein